MLLDWSSPAILRRSALVSSNFVEISFARYQVPYKKKGTQRDIIAQMMDSIPNGKFMPNPLVIEKFASSSTRLPEQLY